jgi:hypothetical protein
MSRREGHPAADIAAQQSSNSPSIRASQYTTFSNTLASEKQAHHNLFLNGGDKVIGR